MDAQEEIGLVAFHADGKHLISQGDEGKLRRWQIENGKEVGIPMAAGSPITCFTVSQDGNRIIGGSFNGVVTLWNAASHKKEGKMKVNPGKCTFAVDMSPDGSKIVTGHDNSAFVVSGVTGQRLYHPLRHEGIVAGVRFSPGEGKFIATATWTKSGVVRIYHSHDAHMVAEFFVTIPQVGNRSLVWASDGRRLFVLSTQNAVHCLDASAGMTLWQLSHNFNSPWCISLTRKDAVLVIGGDMSVSFWDTTTRRNIGPVVKYSNPVKSVATSPGSDFATGAGNTITYLNLRGILPSYYNDEPGGQTSQSSEDGRAGPRKSSLMQDDQSSNKTADLESSVKDLRSQLHTSQRAASEKEDSLNKIIESLYTQDESSKQMILQLRDQLASAERKYTEERNNNANLEKLNSQLSDQLHSFERKSTEEKDSMEAQMRSLLAQQAQSNDKIASLESSAKEKENDLNKMTELLRSDLHLRETSSANLNETIKELNDRLATSQQNADDLSKTVMSLRVDLDASEKTSAKSKEKVDELHNHLVAAHSTLNRIIRGELLYSRGSIRDAVKSLVGITDVMTHDATINTLIVDWCSEFTRKCVPSLEATGNEAWTTGNYDEALAAYSAVLSTTQSNTGSILISWTRIMLLRGLSDELFDTASKFPIPMSFVHQAVYDVLGGDDHVTDAVEAIGQMEGNGIRGQWASNLRLWCIDKMVNLGNIEMKAKNHDSAIKYWSSALSLEPTHDIIRKCCEARTGLLEDELAKAENEIKRDPSSWKGYKRKHSALHYLGQYNKALEALKTMRSKIKNSPDPNIRKLEAQYLDTTPLIRKVVDQTINDIPRVLINLDTGHLYDRARQVASFEKLPIYAQLRSSMIVRERLDYARIRREVQSFFEYVMFSHTWGSEEPTFQMLEKSSIDKLPKSPGNNKLRGFRNIVRSRGFKWLWSDTCCIDQVDKGVQQESIVSMFRWYRRSALTIAHLLGVFSDSDDEDSLWKSIWNTRRWTYQEYVASPVVQFYTEDWKPYRGLDMRNHKDSPLVFLQMERVTKLATKELVTLEPGLNRMREKLHLASRRETKREEDIAYCLFGIFGVSVPVIYGEGKEAAVCRLLQHLLTNSDNVTLLSWTGKPGSGNNSYLPPDLTVYDKIAPPHIPSLIQADEMNSMVRELQSSSLDVSLAIQLYNRLYHLPPLSLVAGRLRLSSFVFPVTDISSVTDPDSDPFLFTYHARTDILGDVEIKTQNDLSGMTNMLLIHPWITPLLDEDFPNGAPLFDETVRALRLVVRLKQLFGALLLAQSARALYKRVATDCFIQVQTRAEMTVQDWMDNIRTIDVQ